MASDRSSPPVPLKPDATAQAAPLTWLVGIIAVVCVIWLLKTAAVVAMPLAAAFFIAITVYPVQLFLADRLDRFRWAALPLTMGLIVAVIGGGMWALAESVDEVAEAAPRYSAELRGAWQTLRQSASDSGVPVPEDLLSSTDLQQRAANLATATVRAVWSTISGLVLVFFLVVLMLLEAPVWGANTRRLLTDRHGRATIETVTEVADKVRQYLYVRTVLGVMSAAAAGAWLLILDVDLVLVWVVLTFLLNYIPNLGSIVAVIPPSLMALLQHGPTYGLLTLGGLAVFEQVIGNFIDPRMQGRRLRVSPVVVLIALVFWTWLWGPVGALLAVPVTITLIVAAARVPSLRTLSTLLAAEHDASESVKEGAGQHAA